MFWNCARFISRSLIRNKSPSNDTDESITCGVSMAFQSRVDHRERRLPFLAGGNLGEIDNPLFGHTKLQDIGKQLPPDVKIAMSAHGRIRFL